MLVALYVYEYSNKCHGATGSSRDMVEGVMGVKKVLHLDRHQLLSIYLIG